MTQSHDATTLDSLLRRRRSIRAYSSVSISLASLAAILAAGQAITDADGKRTAPSAHALHPLRLYVLVRRVQELSAGLYAYDPESGQLTDTGRTIGKGQLLTASLAQDTCLESAAAVIIVGAQRGVAIRHFSDQQADGMRGARYVDVEAGAAVQNMYLRTTAEDLGGVAIMGLDDQPLKDLLRLADEIEPVILFCIGALPRNA